jgi:hypothetical protein
MCRNKVHGFWFLVSDFRVLRFVYVFGLLKMETESVQGCIGVEPFVTFPLVRRHPEPLSARFALSGLGVRGLSGLTADGVQRKPQSAHRPIIAILNLIQEQRDEAISPGTAPRVGSSSRAWHQP